jgi:transcriptional regulator with XRE-family HTH domain
MDRDPGYLYRGEFRKVLGNRIRVLRKRAGMKQLELAKALGYTSTGMISQVEAGQKGMDLEKIHKAAELFQINPAVLLSQRKMTGEDFEMVIDLYQVINEQEGSEYKKAIKDLLSLAVQKIELRKRQKPVQIIDEPGPTPPENFKY